MTSPPDATAASPASSSPEARRWLVPFDGSDCALRSLRHAIGLRAYGQRDPLNEYKREGFEMFEAMLDRLREQATSMLSHIEVRAEQPQAAAPAAPAGPVIENSGIDKNNPATWANLNRNAECPCGSGKKYKHCHGQLTA
mgnify:CR=1 FL=1